MSPIVAEPTLVRPPVAGTDKPLSKRPEARWMECVDANGGIRLEMRWGLDGGRP
jgi:hypothetical protein